MIFTGERHRRFALAWFIITWACVSGLPRPASSRDADGDGLSDEEERALGTSPLKLDTDGDGLLDGWEVNGFFHAGSEEPLPAYGADPLVPDVFVEIDWMETASGSAGPGALIAYQAAVDMVRVFRRSGAGVRLHVDLGPRIESLVPPEVLEGDFDASEFDVLPDEYKILPYQSHFPTRPGLGSSSSAYSLYDVYRGGMYLRSSRRNLFYYFVIAEQQSPATGAAEGGLRNHPFTEDFSDELSRRDGLLGLGVRAGVAFRLPSPQLVPEFLRYHYSVAILHELGHAFGLGHGGALPGFQWDESNYKPNYVSLMNYRYEFCGIDIDGGLPVMGFSHGDIRVPLVESRLLEYEGMGPLPSEHVLDCLSWRRLPSEEYPSNIDWNGDGRISLTPVSVDLNRNGRIDPEPFLDHDDWGQFVQDGFEGIGSRAFAQRGLFPALYESFPCLSGDFDGDGRSDLFVQRGERMAFLLVTPGGELAAPPSAQVSRLLGSWRIGPAMTLLVGDFLCLGFDQVFLHRQREVAIVGLRGSSPALLWYEDSIVQGRDGEASPGWKIQPDDRFLCSFQESQGCSSLFVTNGRSVARLSAGEWDDHQALRVVWSAEKAISDGMRAQPVLLRQGRDVAGEAESRLLAVGADALAELVGTEDRGDIPEVAPLDRWGRIPGEDGDGGATFDDWPFQSDDAMYSVDLTGDGSTEILLKKDFRLGVLGWVDGSARLLWSVEDRVQGFWPLSGRDLVLSGQFVPGGGEEIVLSNGQSWMTLGWDEGTRSLRMLGLNNGYFALGPSKWEIRSGQAMYVGRFLPGIGDVVLVQDAASLMFVSFQGEQFGPVERFVDQIGDWTFDAADRLVPTNVDEDPELELIVRNGLLFGLLDFSPVARCSFVRRLDIETLQFTEGREFLRGDANGDRDVDISDVVTILGTLFLGFRYPVCADASDVDDDGEINISDPIFLLAFLFNHGSIPPAPGPHVADLDPTPDNLTCKD